MVLTAEGAVLIQERWKAHLFFHFGRDRHASWAERLDGGWFSLWMIFVAGLTPFSQSIQALGIPRTAPASLLAILIVGGMGISWELGAVLLLAWMTTVELATLILTPTGPYSFIGGAYVGAVLLGAAGVAGIWGPEPVGIVLGLIFALGMVQTGKLEEK